MNQIFTKYNFQTIEIYDQEWTTIANGQSYDQKQRNFAITLPPPNVTGTLHLGHAWDGVLQDVLIRYKKLNKFNVFWAAGMDHAGIATQSKFEKELKAKKKKRSDFSRKEFCCEIMEWKNNHAQIIRQQWNKMGFALPLKLERFTLDDHSVQTVYDAFKQLHENNLVYQAEKLVNWDCELQTAISNIEVINKETQTQLYTINYQCKTDATIILKVSTTRPETMFGDVCLVVNPNDQRYQKYWNLEFINPANNQALKLIQDDYIDIEFGTGVMKCTPAHDFNDYEIALRHNLPLVKCIGLDGKMLANCKGFAQLSSLECRQKLINQFQIQNLVTMEPYVHSLGYSERSGCVVEPMLSKQWFIKTTQLAKQVQTIISTNLHCIQFWPSNYSKAIFRYLEEMEDWCISRQLTWGIRLPVWYNSQTKQVFVGLTASDQSEKWIQDSDVFDTWFSSGLWPITVCYGFGDKKHFLSKFYPNNVLITGVDILFFWVSRMMMLCGHLSKQMPFSNVYLHGLVRDQNNCKMSKSLNNGIDPQKLIDQYGADALRLFFVSNTSSGEDLIYHSKKMDQASAFLTKLWNAYNFLQHKQINLQDTKFDYQQLDWSQKWILGKLSFLKDELAKNYDLFQFNLIAKKAIDFVWNDFCNWFLEFLKIADLQTNLINNHKLIAYVWKVILQILNPLIPYVTNYIYHQIHGQQALFYAENNAWVSESWPVISHPWYFELIQNVRNWRNQLKLKNDFVFKFSLIHKNISCAQQTIEEVKPFLKIANCDCHQVIDQQIINQKAIYLACESYLFAFECETNIVENYKALLNKQINQLRNEVERSHKILNNSSFLKNAVSEKIILEQTKLQNYQAELNALQTTLSWQK